MDRRRPIWLALFALFMVALLCPLNNLFQPLDRNSPYTDGEFQVAAMAVAGGCFAMVALVRKGDLRLNVTHREIVRVVFSVVRISHPSVRTVRIDTSPPLLIPLRI